MYRNTFLLICALAIFTALLVGIKIGRTYQSKDGSEAATSSPGQVRQPQPQTGPGPKPYTNAFCKLSFEYPSTFKVLENASGSAAFIPDQSESSKRTGPSAEEGILLTCQRYIPRPPLNGSQKEDIRIGSVSASLYHTKTASDSATMDSLIFRHPGTKLDVFLAGTGETFLQLISSITFIP